MIRIIVFIFIGIMFSCEHEPPKVKLNREERVHLDSLFKKNIPSLNDYVDSICNQFEKTQYQRIKDSIISERLQEIDQISPE